MLSLISAGLRALAASLAAVAMAGTAGASTFTVDTSSLAAGTNAVLAIQFNPGPSSPPTTATISAFSGAASAGAADVTGVVVGSLFPGPLTITNTPTLNLLLQPLLLGTSFSFSVAFAGNAGSGDATLFGVSLVDNATDFNPLLTADPAGYLIVGDLFPGVAPALTIVSSFVSVSEVPEPATYALMLAGLLLLYAAARRRGA